MSANLIGFSQSLVKAVRKGVIGGKRQLQAIISADEEEIDQMIAKLAEEAPIEEDSREFNKKVKNNIEEVRERLENETEIEFSRKEVAIMTYLRGSKKCRELKSKADSLSTGDRDKLIESKEYLIKLNKHFTVLESLKQIFNLQDISDCNLSHLPLVFENPEDLVAMAKHSSKNAGRKEKSKDLDTLENLMKENEIIRGESKKLHKSLDQVLKWTDQESSYNS